MSAGEALRPIHYQFAGVSASMPPHPVQSLAEKGLFSERVRVAVRVRPFNEQELRANVHRTPIAVSTDGQTVAVHVAVGGPEHFACDHVLWSQARQGASFASQEEVFKEIGAPLLRGALSGIGSSLVAYGQTGAGKSYSLVGLRSEPGLLPRLAAAACRPGADVRVWFSVIEIYNELARDLLSFSKDSDSREVNPLIECFCFCYIKH